MELISKVKGGDAEVFNKKFPSKSVVVPVFEPKTIMLTPGINSCVSASITEPEIVLCAWTVIALNIKSNNVSTLKEYICFIEL